MTDEELIERLRDWPYQGETMANAAADRIEELTKERDQHWDSFVHWRKEADDRSEQLAAARQDAKEAEAYAEELEKDRDALDAKLAKAVKALGLIVVDNTWGLEHETYMKCRATLAEIKGESHD